MNTTAGKDSMTLLNGGNYIYWRTKVKAILIRDDLWDIVNGLKPEAPTTAWQKQNNKAMALITLSIEDSQLLHIANCDTAFEMWEKLQKQFARSSFGSQLYLRRKLYGIRFTSVSMQNHINSVLEVVELLKGAGTEITTGDLPESYSGLVAALEGRDEADLTVEYMNDHGAVAKVISGDERSRPGSDRKSPQRSTAFTTCERAQIAKANGGWLIDSGCTPHMTNDRSFFTELKENVGEVLLVTKEMTPAEGIGDGKVRCRLPNGNIEDITLRDVLYVPELGGGLMSVSKITKNGYRVIFENEGCRVKQRSDGAVVATARLEGNLFLINSVRTVESAHSAVDTKASLEQRHHRFGHRDPNAVKKLLTDGLVHGLILEGSEHELPPCECCIRGKLNQQPFPNSKSRATKPLGLIHSDLCGPMRTATPSGNRYCLTVIDDYSRYAVVWLLKHTSHVPNAIQEIIRECTTQVGYKPKVLQTDNGKEYINEWLLRLLKQQGIKHQTTVIHTPQQNGVAERKNRSLQEMAKCMLLDSNLPTRFWGEAMLTATYLQNRLPSRSVSKTPKGLWDGKRPNVSHIRIFGSKCFTFVPKQLRTKWDDKAEEGVLVGYSDTTKGYRVLDVASNKVRISRVVKIIEPETPTKTSQCPVSEGEHCSDELDGNFPQPSPVAISPKQSPMEMEVSPRVATPELQVRVSQRATKGQPPKRFCTDAKCHNVYEPASMDELSQLPAREQQLWMKAAMEEMRSMEELQVWQLTDLPPGRKAVTVKWVFKAKLNPKDQVETYKARLVARGFSQRYGQDYDETFAPVVKYDTVRTLLAVAAARKLHVRHLDVRSAYLNSTLEEEIYIEQPPDFVVRGQEDKVLLLHKSLYGLKQSARAWNKMATDTLAKLLFEQGKADQCLFSRLERDRSRTYVLLYVDDLLVVGTTPEITKKVGAQLNKFFQTKDLGDVKNYLGIQIEREGDGSFLLHQRNKIDKLLEPDVAVAVGILSRRVENPMEFDWKSVKRIMRYLSTTKDFKLRLSPIGDMELKCYVDADWAGHKTYRRSTTGFVFKLGNSVMAWSSRKQSVVALSSAEAEYVAASNACRGLLWLRLLLNDLGILISGPVLVFEDNQACIKMVDSDRLGARTKHIDVCHHHLRDLRAQNIIMLYYCPSLKRHNQPTKNFSQPSKVLACWHKSSLCVPR
ncbi:hypothetical protein M514_23395 [Trichuris suis]|uniref:Integrase catalytic domain-containing protein n=1 Tax=Trichuris suis TaxID=68888 RepID=A0A085N4H5_9BILA|nr:hypothetical protein M514_23395 [Trichuris suis]